MIVGFGSVLLTLALSLAGECVEVSRSVYLMGTTAALTTCTSVRDEGLSDLESFLQILEETEQELSTWREDSVISRLNRQPIGVEFPLSPRMFRMFSELALWSDRTEGTFDPSVGALTATWGIHKDGRLPSLSEVEAARARTGMNHFRLNAGAHRITRLEDATIDVGAFGKGEGLDRVADYAAERKGSAFLIDLGGQVLVRTSEHQPFWTVDVAHPMYRERAATSVRLRSGSLSTSGGSERDLSVNGKRIGHHIDPRSGQSVVSDVSVSVWHERALIADMLSTALYVMGVEEGLRWAEQNEIAACFLIPSSNGVQLRTTKSWELLLSY